MKSMSVIASGSVYKDRKDMAGLSMAWMGKALRRSKV
jgi:hypothetical protein